MQLGFEHPRPKNLVEPSKAFIVHSSTFFPGYLLSTKQNQTRQLRPKFG